jgi:hypothetical protein
MDEDSCKLKNIYAFKLINKKYLIDVKVNYPIVYR